MDHGNYWYYGQRNVMRARAMVLLPVAKSTISSVINLTRSSKKKKKQPGMVI